MRVLVYSILLILLGSSCNSNKLLKDQSKNKCYGLRMDADEYASASNEGVKILDAKVNDDCLTITYEIKDACKETSIDMHWDYRVKKSMPPVATLRVNRTGKMECGVKLYGVKKFDLKELSNPAYKGKIYLKILPLENKLLYEYTLQQ